jgi:hypothetical protein
LLSSLAAGAALMLADRHGGAAARNGAPRLVIIGAGFGGLSCAYQLQRAGALMTVMEALPRLGGGVHLLDSLLSGKRVLYTVMATTWSFIVHANVNWRLGWLELFIATPSSHHWHHITEDKRCINKNYATFLPLIDRIFGSYYLPSKRWQLSYGLVVEQDGEFEKASVG